MTLDRPLLQLNVNPNVKFPIGFNKYQISTNCRKVNAFYLSLMQSLAVREFTQYHLWCIRFIVVCNIEGFLSHLLAGGVKIVLSHIIAALCDHIGVKL